MTVSSFLKSFAPYAAVLGLSLAAAGVAAESVDELMRQGRAELGGGQYAQALESFDAAFALRPDSNQELRLGFYKAVALQKRAREADAGEGHAMLEEAARLYTVYRNARPGDAAAANNLAKVYEQLGWPDQAVELYEKAVASGDSRKGLYLKNYAELLDSSGEWQQASKVYDKLVREQPLAYRQQEALAARYAERGLNELTGYLWEMIDAGGSMNVASLALDALSKNGNEQVALRRELIAIVALALSGVEFDPRTYADSGLRERLAGVGRDDAVGDGARELSRLLDHSRGFLTGRPDEELLANLERKLTPQAYVWWADQDNPEYDAKRGVWPAQAFRRLVVSLGLRMKQTATELASREKVAARYRTIAQAYFELAANLSLFETDPAAVREMVRLAVGSGDGAAIDRVLAKYEYKLFDGKGNAYRQSALTKTFEYHKTLGELYAQLGRWGDSSSYRSAVFQLEHARYKSHEIESRFGIATKQEYRFDPNLVDMLSRAYTATGRSRDVAVLRIEEAERFKNLGDNTAVLEVLQPLRVSPPTDQALLQRYNDVAIALPQARNITTPTPDVLATTSLTATSTSNPTIRIRRDRDFGLTAGQLTELETALAAKLKQGPDTTLEDERFVGQIESIELRAEGQGRVLLNVDGRAVELDFEKVEEATRDLEAVRRIQTPQ